MSNKKVIEKEAAAEKAPDSQVERYSLENSLQELESVAFRLTEQIEVREMQIRQIGQELGAIRQLINQKRQGGG